MLEFSRSGRDCERTRELVSLALDGALSEVEDAQLAAHARACPACERRAREIRALTEALRAAPLETPTRRFVAPARPRVARRFAARAALAATLAAMAAGLGVLAGSLGREPAPAPPSPPEVALLDERREDVQVRDRRRANERPTEREAPRVGGV